MQNQDSNPECQTLGPHFKLPLGAQKTENPGVADLEGIPMDSTQKDSG